MSLVLRGQRVVTPDGVRPASVHIEGDKISRLGAWDDVGVGELYDAGESLVMPGLVDSHVHVNEPGRTEWEGFATATRAAAAGGITTIVDMPLNSVPSTTTMRGLEAKRRLAPISGVEVAFWGGVVPTNRDELEDLATAGVRG